MKVTGKLADITHGRDTLRRLFYTLNAIRRAKGETTLDTVWRVEEETLFEFDIGEIKHERRRENEQNL